MSEITLLLILVTIIVLSLVFYLIIIDLRKNRRMYIINKNEVELIRIEKEVDRTDAIKRGMHILISDKRKAINKN